MRPDVDTRTQRTTARERRNRRRSRSKRHVRLQPAPERRDTSDHVSRASEAPVRRMVPRDHARPAGQVSVSQRRAERKARKVREQERVRRATERARRRQSVLWKLMTWRTVSGMLVIGLSVVLYMLLTMDAFYVRSVAVGGEKYLTREEIFTESDIALKHVLRIDPVAVEARLESIPSIADASVYIGWPPDMVQIVVVEREPALIWEQSNVGFWVDVNGIVMVLREDRDDLVRVVVRDADEPLTEGARIPQTIVDGALYLHKFYPNTSVLLYNSEKGLGHYDSRGWTVWFGSGVDMATKLLVYTELVEEIRGVVQPGEIFMNDPDRPYYTVMWYE